MYICEHKGPKTIGCSDGQTINIKYAMYGRLKGSICTKYNQENWECTSQTSLTVVENKCQGKKSCSLTATNGWFGDPCVSVNKYLEVKYECVKGT